jgi:hypothetical protein
VRCEGRHTQTVPVSDDARAPAGILFDEAGSAARAAGPRAGRIQPHLVRRFEAELRASKGARQELVR